MTVSRLLTCTADSRTESIPVGQARVAGWRCGVTAGGRWVAYCPECTGVDAGYWDRRTPDIASCVTCDLPEHRWDPTDRLYLYGASQCPDCIRVDLDEERQLDHLDDHQEAA